MRRVKAVCVFQCGGWIYVVSLALAALLPADWQIGLAAAAFTFASVPTVTVWESHTARLVPDELTGRVGAASSFCAQSLTWLGLVLAGWLADEWGATVAALCFAAILVPFAIAGHAAKSLALGAAITGFSPPEAAYEVGQATDGVREGQREHGRHKQWPHPGTA